MTFRSRNLESLGNQIFLCSGNSVEMRNSAPFERYFRDRL
jgi:hypothetical protein